jgi:Mrp family chromosome partitioning ATPase
LGLWPETVAFEPVDHVAASVLNEIVDGPAAALTAVVLVVGASARASAWAGRAATAIAARWPGSRRVVLLDADMEQPCLHTLTGVRNEEGIADIVDYGVSLARVRQPSAQGDYDVVPTGLYAAEPAVLLLSDAWTRVILEIAARRETLLIYVPADAPGASRIVDRVGAVLVLAESDEAQQILDRLPDPFRVLAVLTPPQPVTQMVQEPVQTLDADDEPVVIAAGAAELLDGVNDDEEQQLQVAPAADPPVAAAPDAPASAVEELEIEVVGPAPGRPSDEEFERIRLPTEQGARATLIAELRERQRAARMAPPADSDLLPQPAKHGEPPRQDHTTVLLPSAAGEGGREMRAGTMGDDVPLDTLDPGSPQKPARPSRYSQPLAWTLFVVLAVALLGGSWRFLAGRLSVDRERREPTEAVVPAVPAPTPPAQPAAEVALPFVVAMEAHTDLAAAFRRVDALNEEPALSFHIAPLEREGTLFYHVMAGPVPDSASAIALRDTLLARRLKTAATPTDVRLAPLSFVIGDYSTRAAAEEAMNELRRLDVPGYMQMAEAADGAPLYRVFVGAFTAPAEADVTRQLLRGAGVRDSLVLRMGSITQ